MDICRSSSSFNVEKGTIINEVDTLCSIAEILEGFPIAGPALGEIVEPARGVLFFIVPELFEDLFITS